MPADLKSDIDAFQEGNLSCTRKGIKLLNEVWSSLDTLSVKQNRISPKELERETSRIVDNFIREMEIQRGGIQDEYERISQGFSGLKERLNSWLDSQDGLDASQKYQSVHPDDEKAVTALASSLKVEFGKLAGQVKSQSHWIGLLLEALNRAEPGVTQEVVSLMKRISQTGDFDSLARAMAAMMHPYISRDDKMMIYFAGLTFLSNERSLHIGDAGVLMLIALISETPVSIYFESEGRKGSPLVIRFTEGRFHFYNQLPSKGGLYLKVTRDIDFKYLGHLFDKNISVKADNGLLSVSDEVDRESIKLQLHGQATRPQRAYLKVSDPCFGSTDRSCQIAMAWLFRKDNPNTVVRMMEEALGVAGGASELTRFRCDIWLSRGHAGRRFNEAFERQGITRLFHREMTEHILEGCSDYLFFKDEL
ncbi:MAG: hypothetical protein ACR2PT_10075 [Endozoicomonas sp.]